MADLSSRTDQELFADLRRGVEAALDELFRRHYAGLCQIAIRFVGDGGEAEDIVQELFLSIWEKREKLPEDVAGVGAYLRRATRNRSLNFLRDRNRIPVDDGDPPEAHSSLGNPGEQIEAAELRQRIDRAIDRLPERCRLIFVMSRIEEMSHREISEALDISNKTVENQMTRAYRFLRQWLALYLLISGIS
ncbi:RNA polymerase sigma-70 factor [Lewinella sp. W8]|uniref:RNA polymerase sigma-70 factor n=1 Tax=Lewinella sp. W8 TaxID=2528208 RepID=UPI0010683F71|nr:RNA polymerase sigma-70 factor [Lewinella sp. W8]MTB51355.1 RNA polymerase sigma-70 factor [Lewinella sp. W8]